MKDDWNGEDFSTKDMEFFAANKVTGYVGTPYGSLGRYRPFANAQQRTEFYDPTKRQWGIHNELVDDPRHPQLARPVVLP